MTEKFNIRFSEQERRFEEDLIIGTKKSHELVRGIMDTGATVTIMDLGKALSLGGLVVGMDQVVGVSGQPIFTYIIRIGVGAIHTFPDKRQVFFKEEMDLRAIPHFERGGKIEVVLVKTKQKYIEMVLPIAMFEIGMPGVPMKTILENILIADGKPVIHSINQMGLGVPLLVGVDIMKKLKQQGFPIKFEF